VNADYEVTGASQMVTPTFPHKLYLPIVACASSDGSGSPSLGIPMMNLAPARVTYRFNGQQVAVREGVTLTFVYGDHLGSASLTTNISGTKVSEMRYYPFGETRYASGTTVTPKQFNAKEQQTDIGLYDYGARFYDPTIGRFISADSVVPKLSNPQKLNRYAYTLNNPLKYTDITGHDVDGCNNGVCLTAGMGGNLYGIGGTCLSAALAQAQVVYVYSVASTAETGFAISSIASRQTTTQQAKWGLVQEDAYSPSDPSVGVKQVQAQTDKVDFYVDEWGQASGLTKKFCTVSLDICQKNRRFA
jgi:RHS repeat-associated protein